MTKSASELTFLDPGRVIFPDPRQALSEPEGLLAVGGNLHCDTLIKAYSSGIFPWFEEGQPPLWWSPNPRAVIFPDRLHISKSLRKTLRTSGYEISTDRAFSEVIHACAGQRRHSDGTWITAAMIQAYTGLFERGVAHSVECWMDGQLAGGLYGVTVGGVFCGESMFSRRPDASKIALAHLAGALNDSGFALIDCQIGNDHLFSLGATLIDRGQFLNLLQDNLESKIIWPVENISAKLFTHSAYDDKS